MRSFRFQPDTLLALALCVIKLLIHFFSNGQYGFHRDELLYLALGEHLDVGYMEVPPFIAVAAKVSRVLFGESLFAMRFFPAVAGVFVVWLACRFARELGGGRFAVLVAGLAVIVSPAFLRSDTLCSPCRLTNSGGCSPLTSCCVTSKPVSRNTGCTQDS